MIITKDLIKYAVNKSIEHWIFDLLIPLTEGKKVILEEDTYCWDDNLDPIKDNETDCYLCGLDDLLRIGTEEIFCRRCPLWIHTEVGCLDEMSPYQNWIENHNEEAAIKMIQFLDELRKEEVLDKLEKNFQTFSIT